MARAKANRSRSRAASGGGRRTDGRAGGGADGAKRGAGERSSGIRSGSGAGGALRAPRRSPRPDDFRDGWLAAGLIVLAWLHRLAFLRSNRDWSWPYTIFYEGDSETFFHYARALLAGRLYDGGIPFHPPGFPGLLALVHAGLGAGGADDRVPYFAVKAVMALLGSASVGILYLLVRPYLGRTVALVAALLTTYDFGLYVLHVAPVSEGAYQTLLLLCVLLWTRWLEHPLAVSAEMEEPREALRSLAWRPVVLGVLFGALALVRAEGALIGLALGLVGLGGWFAARLRRSPRASPAALVPWTLLLAGWLLAVAPWTVRNAMQLRAANQRLSLAEPLPALVPITLYGPINLALANNPLADGTFSRRFLASDGGSGLLDLENPEHLRFLLHGDEMARDWARAHPGDAARLVLRKWRLMADAWRLGWTQWDWPAGLDGVRRPIDVFVPASMRATWLRVPLAVIGLGLCWACGGHQRRWLGVVLVLTAICLLTTGLFFGYARQGLLYMPLWQTFGAVTLVTIGQAVARRRPALPALDAEERPPRRFLVALACAAVVLLAMEARGARSNRNYRATGTTLPGSQKLDSQQQMTLQVVR